MPLFVLGYLVRIKIEHAIALHVTQDQVNKLNEELTYTSYHDILTGLPNRHYLKQELEKIKMQSDESNNQFALIFLDLDHFKNINDTLGHDIGDAFLQSVANILKTTLPSNSFITRIGGDEFVLVIRDFQDNAKLLLIINKLHVEFRRELFIKGYSLRLSASMGIAIYPDDSTNIKELMKYADIAMYKSKAGGRDNFSFFTQELNTKIHDEVEIINDMQRAYYDGEFKLYYQPQIDVETNKIVGAEALLRWEKAEGLFIPPSVFIPFAESTGFILTLGSFVVQEGISMMRRLHEIGHEKLVISINVSARQFQNSNLYEELYEVLQTNRVPSSMLGVEITESIMMKNSVKTLYALQEIKKLGASVYIDDFGTGYSSLGYLKKFPIDILKIDKSFVDDIKADDENSAVLLNTILAMGKTLGLKVIAEGVEESYQYEYLKEQGCDSIQGYYFAKPMPESEFMALLKKGV